HKFAIGGDDFQDEINRLKAPVDSLIGPFEEQLDADSRQAVENVKKQVLENEWRAFFLTVEEKLPIADVAATLNMPIAAVYAARHRVRTLLRNEFGNKMN